ncbi:hypothetical protein Pse7367_1514 [Thalassoporum mexicanum PCC 7367]|uniref:hypothetical protein n=1 Tax=Thalassoporum mexicanum TaxID=3457544 RepID=UPI00029FA043|nr:hypothetical protein [Pseudanabaena sp. PCC 7367]AFY69803.1 hypothetical protein Pse7367_1514 [Pseudanabaena sp. PCC 7367]
MPYSQEPQQGSLFSLKEFDSPVYKVESTPYEMGATELGRWKDKIINYQQQLRAARSPQAQTNLLELVPNHCDPDAIDPFGLEPRPLSFWRYPEHGASAACIYFVIDHACGLLLYVGETCRSSTRWKGAHDCKRYADNYVYLHGSHNLTRQLGISFWWDAPIATRPRQQLESNLIAKWKPPFNRENWQLWHTPFVGD